MWVAKKHYISIKEVSDRYVKERTTGIWADLGDPFFDTYEEARQWKEKQLNDALARAEAQLKDAKKELARFEKKYPQ